VRSNVSSTLLIALMSLGLVACQAQPRFSRPDTTHQQFMKDRYECMKESQRPRGGAAIVGGIATSNVRYVVDCGLATSCMAARGYKPDQNGPLVAPPEAEVECAP
jgi:hypothetical protein